MGPLIAFPSYRVCPKLEDILARAIGFNGLCEKKRDEIGWSTYNEGFGVNCWG